MEKRIQQHRTVSGREDKPVAIPPAGIRRIVTEEFCPQHIRHRRRSHRHAGMAGFRFLNAVDGQGTDGVDAQLIESGHNR